MIRPQRTPTDNAIAVTLPLSPCVAERTMPWSRSPQLQRCRLLPQSPTPTPSSLNTNLPLLQSLSPLLLAPFPRRSLFPLRANPNDRTPVPENGGSNSSGSKGKEGNSNAQKVEEPEEEEEEEEVEEHMSTLEETALDLKEYSESIVQAIPGPRVWGSSLPWLLAIPLTYAGVSFVVAFVKTVKKFYSPKGRHQRVVSKNAFLLKSVNDLLQKGGEEEIYSGLKSLMRKTGFSMEEILRKYIRYVFNEKPFNPDLVATLIQLRKASQLEDSQVAEVLNDISRRIVGGYGPVVMDASGYSEKGFKKKLAVRTLFGKVLYLSELPEFCSKDSSLIVKEIFGVTDEDVDELRISTFSEAGDVDSLEKLVDESDSEEDNEKNSAEPK
ncbi:hypothetical protein Dimus_010097 [Dionaea muscipula]